jgi:hypothetical protein
MKIFYIYVIKLILKFLYLKNKTILSFNLFKSYIFKIENQNF